MVMLGDRPTIASERAHLRLQLLLVGRCPSGWLLLRLVAAGLLDRRRLQRLFDVGASWLLFGLLALLCRRRLAALLLFSK